MLRANNKNYLKFGQQTQQSDTVFCAHGVEFTFCEA